MSDTASNDDLQLESMNFTPQDGLQMVMSHPLFFNLFSDIVGLFKDKGAVNVLEFSAIPKDESIGELTVTIQRKDGKTFGELNAELRQQLAEKDKQIGEKCELIKQLVARCNYLECVEMASDISFECSNHCNKSCTAKESK